MVCIEKFKKILIIVCVLAVIFSCISVCACAAEPLETTSTSVLVTELSSDTVLLSEEPEISINPGSLVKIAALYVIARECFKGSVSLADTITITSNTMMRDSGKIPLKKDEVFTLEQLIYLMYMEYSDTAAAAAAIHVAGSIEEFVNKMNETAEKLGCSGTHFENITGANSDGQRTTPEDLLLVLKAAIQNSVFMDVFTATSYTVRDTNKSISRSMGTQNLLQRPGSDYYVSNCKGGRIGGFSESGYATVSLSEGKDTGMKLIAITAGGAEYGESYKDASSIIQWTFANFSWQTVLRAGETITRIPVEMGSGTDYIVVGSDKDINVLIDNEISALDFKQDITIYSERDGKKLTAPIHRGEMLGELTLLYGGKAYGTVTLVANRDVDLMRWEYFKNEVKNTIQSSGVIWCIVLVILMLMSYLVYSVLFWVKQIKKKKELAETRRELILARRSGAPLQAVACAEVRIDTSDVLCNNAQNDDIDAAEEKPNVKDDASAELLKPVEDNPEAPMEYGDVWYDFSLDIPEDAAYEILFDDSTETAVVAEFSELAESSETPER